MRLSTLTLGSLAANAAAPVNRWHMATLLGTWLTVREVAQHLKAPERTIRHWITHGTGSPSKCAWRPSNSVARGELRRLICVDLRSNAANDDCRNELHLPGRPAPRAEGHLHPHGME